MGNKTTLITAAICNLLATTAYSNTLPNQPMPQVSPPPVSSAITANNSDKVGSITTPSNEVPPTNIAPPSPSDAVAEQPIGLNEKCYNIVKAGMNDCAAADASHSCKGYATKDGSNVDFIELPNGLCNKIVGSSLKPPRA
jgi:uncharacterized membrane protein